MVTVLLTKRLFLMLVLSGAFFGISQPIVQAAGQGNTLDVQVLDSTTGKALSDVAVCLGTAANSAQFGSIATDERGAANFTSVPKSPLQLTVSRPGYLAKLHQLEPLTNDRVLVLKLVGGWQKGPVCKLSAVAGNDSTNELVITGLDLDLSDAARGTVRVETRVRGEAGQVRVSESADFDNASWQVYRPSVDFQLSKGEGRKRLYVQVRRYAKMNGAFMQSLSPVVSSDVSVLR